MTDDKEMQRRIEAGNRWVRGEVPVTRNEMVEILAALDVGVVNAASLWRAKWDLTEPGEPT